MLILTACAGKPEYQTTRQVDTQNAENIAITGHGTFNVIDYGADPTSVSLSTEAIQRAIDDCTAQGGGTVVIPEGIYTTGPITLRSNVRLYTEPNCFVLFSHDFDLYEILDIWFEGVPTKRCTSPLNAQNAENIAITGHGTFNGQASQDDRWTVEEAHQGERRHCG